MYEWLEKYQEWQQKISVLEWELDTYKSELARWKDSNDLGKYKLVKESKASKLEEKIESLQYELAHKMNQIYDLRKIIYSFRGLEQRILILKYIEGYNLKEIAKKTKYSHDHIRRKHREIMQKVTFKYSVL